MNPILEFRQVSYSYPTQDAPALRNVSFAVTPGEFLGILGADESGKTTLAKLCTGRVLPSAGVVYAGGILLKPPPAERPIRIGIVFSDPENQIVGTTVEEDVAFGLGNLCVPPDDMRRSVDEYLDRFGFAAYAKRSPRELSGGEQQKLCLAGVLAMQPDCLIVDEPLSFLDAKSRGELLRLLLDINRAGTTIVYLTHDLQELGAAQRILLLKQGAIMRETDYAALWNAPNLLELAGIAAPELLRFRARLREQGFSIRDDSVTPDTIATDVINMDK